MVQNNRLKIVYIYDYLLSGSPNTRRPSTHANEMPDSKSDGSSSTVYIVKERVDYNPNLIVVSFYSTSSFVYAQTQRAFCPNSHDSFIELIV